MHHVHGFDTNGGGNITRERAFAKRKFEEGHVCILHGVVRATLIFIYRIVVTVIAIRLAEVTPS